MVPLAREFVDTVYVNRIDRVFFIDRQIFRPAVDLSCAGENNFQIAVVQPAGFQNVKLGRGVDIQISHRIRHRVEVAGLAGQVKKKLAFLDQRRHCGSVANIGQINSHAIADVVNIKKVAAVFWNQAVDQGHLCAELDQAPGEGGTDKTEPAGDQDVGAGKNVRIPGHGRIVGCGRKDFL